MTRRGDPMAWSPRCQLPAEGRAFRDHDRASGQMTAADSSLRACYALDPPTWLINSCRRSGAIPNRPPGRPVALSRRFRLPRIVEPLIEEALRLADGLRSPSRLELVPHSSRHARGALQHLCDPRRQNWGTLDHLVDVLRGQPGSTSQVDLGDAQFFEGLLQRRPRRGRCLRGVLERDAGSARDALRRGPPDTAARAFDVRGTNGGLRTWPVQDILRRVVLFASKCGNAVHTIGD